jgi:ADP-ribosyl-[dinitrogen reductase] hydrolase
MRVAPVGVVSRRNEAFKLGCETAALTYSHPSGILSAGFLALLIAEIMAGNRLQDAIRAAKTALIECADHTEVLRAVEKAEALALSPATSPIPESLGQGWIAEEALAMALYCALVAANFEEAVVLAVNHSGDSDSTGAITGNICGALYGLDAIPARWLDAVELRHEITAVADDLAALVEGKLDVDSDLVSNRYPGW